MCAVSNCVRQVSLLSTALLAIYVEDLSIALSKNVFLWFVGSSIVKILFYTNDLVLIILLSDGLRKHVSVCEAYAKIIFYI